MVALATSLIGCAGAGEVFQLASTTAFSFMLAPLPQTYRLTVKGMTVPAGKFEENAFPESLRKNIYVTEIEGTETLKHLNGIALDAHDDSNVKAALSNSLNLAGLLNTDQKVARYQLSTVVTENRSSGAADVTVTTHLQFVLTEAATRETLLQESIATPSTVPVSEELLYKDRVGKAMEGSVKGDIRALLERLKQIPIDGGGPAS